MMEKISGLRIGAKHNQTVLNNFLRDVSILQETDYIQWGREGRFVNLKEYFKWSGNICFYGEASKEPLCLSIPILSNS